MRLTVLPGMGNKWGTGWSVLMELALCGESGSWNFKDCRVKSSMKG